MTQSPDSTGGNGDESSESIEKPRVPDHDLIRLIGAGSGGKVWLARSALGTHRAVKVVHAISFKHRRLFDQEFAGLLKFEPISRLHDGFVDILHVGRNEAADYFYCVMELADDLNTGQNIAPESYQPRTLAHERTRQGKLSIAECVRFGAAIASALGFLHKHGLTHRDIKPSNIVFVNGFPKLADTGLVSEMSNARNFVGTEGFIPPEGHGTVKADIYSFGKVLYEISTGRDRSDYPILPELPDSDRERLDLVEFNKIILTACRSNPRKRFASAEELMSALLSFQFGQETMRKKKRLRAAARIIGVIGALVAPALWLISPAGPPGSSSIRDSSRGCENTLKESCCRSRVVYRMNIIGKLAALWAPIRLATTARKWIRSGQSAIASGTHGSAAAALRLLVGAGLLLAGCGRAGATVIFVNVAQTNNPSDGTTWAKAFPSVQVAITNSNSGDQIWVARGSYYQSVFLKAEISLFGGFLGDETLLSQRGWVTNQTILDGQKVNLVVEVAAGATNTTQLDGFVIRNGSNTLAGGIYCSNASPVIRNNVILGNRSSQGAGGITCIGGAPLIAFNRIQGNEGREAGGIKCVNSAALILNNQLAGNGANLTSSSGGSGVYATGNSTPTVANNVIIGNRTAAAISGGAICVEFGTALVVNNTIAWNFSSLGPSAGIRCTATTTMANNLIVSNSIGINSASGAVIRNNCVFGNILNYQGTPSQTGTNGNISVDPVLALANRYPEIRLADASPCRDAGDDAYVPGGSLDVFGAPRIFGAKVDIGASEWAGTPAPYVPPVVRVSPSGSDAADGGSWTQAKQTVQAAINAATILGGEVWVRTGSYNENLNLLHFVGLFGGFSGTETNRSQRNWNANPTILNGGGNGSVISATNLMSWNTIDGFVITNGNAFRGGGIYCESTAPALLNNTIVGNTATLGGGFYSFAGIESLVVDGNQFLDNSAVSGGGAYCPSKGAVITRNRFERNIAAAAPTTAGVGGGGGLFAGPAIISENLFINNIATNGFTCTFNGSFYSNPWQGSAIYSQATIPDQTRVINNTLLTNMTVSVCSGIWYTGATISASSLLAANNVICFGSGGLPGAGTKQNNCVYGNTRNYLSTDETGMNGNISVDPQLVGPNDYHLSSASPCINSGRTNVVVSATDYAQDPRVVGGSVDIGVFEYQSPASIISYAWLQKYGLLTDGSADHADTDGDGADNWLEWQYTTNPTNALSAPSPVFLTQPRSRSQVRGLPTSLSAAIGGATPIGIQWQLHGTNLPGATGTNLSFGSLQAKDVGPYRIIATNGFGATTSSIAAIEFGQVATWGGSMGVPPGATNLMAIVAGAGYGLWLRHDGTVKGWYTSSLEDLPIPINPTNVVAISDAADLLANGAVLVWGGQTQAEVPADLTNAVAVATGTDHALALRADRRVVAWGYNGSGQLDVPVNLTNAVAISAGDFHSLALTQDGTVIGWGDNSFGQAINSVPVTNAIAVSGGLSYSLALRSDGTVVGWGNSTLTNVPAWLGNVLAIAAGPSHCLALRQDGTVVAWGSSSSGQTNVPGSLSNVLAVSAGNNYSMALVGDGPPIQRAMLTKPALTGNSFSLQLPTQSGRVYGLEHASSLTGSSWVASPLVAGNGTNLVLADPFATNSPRFYRVRRW